MCRQTHVVGISFRPEIYIGLSNFVSQLLFVDVGISLQSKIYFGLSNFVFWASCLLVLNLIS